MVFLALHLFLKAINQIIVLLYSTLYLAFISIAERIIFKDQMKEDT